MNIIRSANFFKNHARFMPDVLNINLCIVTIDPGRTEKLCNLSTVYFEAKNFLSHPLYCIL